LEIVASVKMAYLSLILCQPFSCSNQ